MPIAITGNDSAGGTLYERSAELNSRIGELVAARSGVQSVSVLQTRREEIRRDADSLVNAMRIFQALRSHGIVAAVDPAFVTGSLLHWRDFRNAQKADPHYLTSAEGIKAYRDQRRFLTGLTRTVQDNSRAAWEAYVDGRLPDVDETLIDSLARVPRFVQEAAALRVALAQLKQFRTPPPRSASEIDNFLSACDAFRVRYKALEDHGVPSDILSFFAALKEGEGRVPLTLLTPSVRHWIDAEQMTGRFYVSAG